MRFMIMHRTDARWEAGATPTPALIQKVGEMMGELARTGTLLAGEGLRASSLGARVTFAGGRRTVTPGPLRAGAHPPAGFAILRTTSLEEAIDSMSRFAELVGDVVIDVRPVTEEWDIGMGPKPEGLTTTRYMALHSSAAAEAKEPPSPRLIAEMGGLIEEMTRAGVLLAAEGLLPTSKGARVKAAGGKYTVIDGPFAESKELIAGYVIVATPSLREAKDLALRYAETVETDEVDVRAISG